jgi:hypothetical protein
MGCSVMMPQAQRNAIRFAAHLRHLFGWQITAWKWDTRTSPCYTGRLIRKGDINIVPFRN